TVFFQISMLVIAHNANIPPNMFLTRPVCNIPPTLKVALKNRFIYEREYTNLIIVQTGDDETISNFHIPPESSG
ncbi:MAG: hypothetical protein ACKPKO_20080, partial [Candidatus Fonsibacter sp.]